MAYSNTRLGQKYWIITDKTTSTKETGYLLLNKVIYLMRDPDAEYNTIDMTIIVETMYE